MYLNPRHRQHRGPTFHGALEQLQYVVALTGRAGRWQWMASARFWRFRCEEDGAILNWWPTTRTVNFQGPPAAKAAFELAIIDALKANEKRVPAERWLR